MTYLFRYNVQGPTNLRCWLGEWAVTSMPECVAGKYNFKTFKFKSDFNLKLFLSFIEMVFV